MNMKSENKNAKPEKNKSTFTIPNSVILPTSTPPGRQMLKTAGIAASCALGVTLAISVPIALNVQQSNANFENCSTFNAKVQYITSPHESTGSEDDEAKSDDELETKTAVTKSAPNPPNLELLLHGSTETFFDYLRELEEAYGALAWSTNAIRLDHEGVQDESYISLWDNNNNAQNDAALANAQDIGRISMTSYVVIPEGQDVTAYVTTLFNLPDYDAYSIQFASHNSDKPYEDKEGVGFDCRYNEEYPWSVSGTIHKVDTCDGEDTCMVTMALSPYVEC